MKTAVATFMVVLLVVGAYLNQTVAAWLGLIAFIVLCLLLKNSFGLNPTFLAMGDFRRREIIAGMRHACLANYNHPSL